MARPEGKTKLEKPPTRHHARHLPAFLLLVVPLAALAWLGSAELNRQSDLALRSVREQARRFVDGADREISGIADRVDYLLDNIPDLGARWLVEATEDLIASEPSALDLLAVDADGQLLFPRPPPRLADGLPFPSRSPVEQIDRAEVLEALGDLEGARDLLLNAIPPQAPPRQLMRAQFALGGIMRALGQNPSAEDHYFEASIEAMGLQGNREPIGSGRASSVLLLCEVALAELANARDVDSKVLDLMRNIAEGQYDALPDRLLDEVMHRLATLIEPTSDVHEGVVAAIRTNEVRLRGREFAREYESLIEQAVRRKIGVSKGVGPVYDIHTGPGGSSLIALRPLFDAEALTSRTYLPDGGWIGVRLDLELLLTETFDPYLVAGDDVFQIAVADPDGERILDSTGNVEAVPEELKTTRTSFAGLRLEAVPFDHERFLATRRETIRNRTLLVLALCLAAGGGAFLLIRSAARESEVAALKVELVSRVSHELKTPLALIKMYSETLSLGRSANPEQTERFLSIIAREADSLTRMIERVLDFSRIELGALTFERESTDLGEVLTAVADSYRPQAEARGVRVEVDAPAGVVARVDPGALGSAVLNLLDNALKYTPEDRPDAKIELGVAVDGASAIIEVRDRGIGIAPTELDQVFTSFFRGSNAGRTRGAGLGLGLVRHFARGHGGDVVAMSRDGGGTIIRINVLLEETHASSQHPDH